VRQWGRESAELLCPDKLPVPGASLSSGGRLKKNLLSLHRGMDFNGALRSAIFRWHPDRWSKWLAKLQGVFGEGEGQRRYGCVYEKVTEVAKAITALKDAFVAEEPEEDLNASSDD